MGATRDSTFTLADAEQRIADLERQLAERAVELDEALQRETATSEVLGVINSSPGDLAPVFEAMLEKAMTLCGAVFGALMSYDGERVSAVATRGLPPELVDVFREPVTPRRDGDAPYARFLRGEPVLHIADMAADAVLPSLASRPRALVEIGGARTGLELPLRKEGILLGSIWLYRQEVRPFSEKEIALARNFAGQAVIAMENARLITETREALEQQTATAEVLQVINASPGDLAPVFEAILEKAHNLCGVTIGALEIWDGEHIRAVATRGLPASFESLVRQGYRPTADDPHWRLLEGAPFVHIADQAAIEEPTHRKAVEHGIRTFLGIALRKNNVLLGRIVAARGEVRPFSEPEIAMLQNFAAQAVIAIENARLLGELRARTADLQESLEHQTATSNVLKVISRSDAELSTVLETLVETAARLCQAEAANIFLHHAEGLRRMASVGVAVETRAALDANPPRADRHTVVGRTVITGQITHIEDVSADPDFSEGAAPAMRATLAAGIRTMLGVPLLREDVPIGSISLGRREVQPFTDKQIELVRTFADQAVIAIENSRLLGELRQRTDEIAELNRGLKARVAAQIEELNRVGRLKRFLAPQLAELIVSQGDENILESHRREIVVVFCDLRGYTAFTETAEPEEVLDFLREYHGALGPLVSQFEGTLDQFSGDGIMVFFNDPVPIPDPAERAVKMAVAMREEARSLIAAWRRRDRDLGFVLA